MSARCRPPHPHRPSSPDLLASVGLGVICGVIVGAFLTLAWLAADPTVVDPIARLVR